MTDESGHAPTGADEYWFNTKTGEVEHGHQSSWPHLMGPYASRDEAANALANAQRRNDDWDAED